MRYTIDGSVTVSRKSKYDIVVVGAGIAGLYSLLNLDPSFSCCVLAKESIDSSSSWLAQGGIAAATSSQDDPEMHFSDTMVAGAGLCNPDAVHVLVNEGASDIRKLIEMDVPFDLDESGELDRTREGGHHFNRIVHAGGDATGMETVKALSHIAAQRDNIEMRENTFFLDILTDGKGSVSGVIAVDRGGNYEIISTRNLIIATGGIGQVYISSTNPTVSTGDGLAAAERAGAELGGMEFVQFHPTGLWVPSHRGQSFLISESVRGEGGLLKNSEGVRFMLGTHELNELAPRDIVTRAIIAELNRTGESHAYIDITSRPEDYLRQRFPTIFGECMKYGINMSKDFIPVAPVQHYMMGGIKTDLSARSSLKGLYACGEAASTGVHGANRLASNSMLECLVFGRRAAENINSTYSAGEEIPDAELPSLPVRPALNADFEAVRLEMQTIMSEDCFVIRSEEGMTHALERMQEILSYLESGFDRSLKYAESVNLATISIDILRAALARKESIGAHYRIS